MIVEKTKPAPAVGAGSGYADTSTVYIEMAALKGQHATRMTRVAFAALFVSALSIVGNIYQAQLPRERPYVVNENGDGSTGVGTILRPAERPNLAWEKYQLAQWIVQSRATSTDPTVAMLYNQHTAMLLLHGSPAEQTVASYYQGLTAAGSNRRVTVKINYVRPRSAGDHVFEADWVENVIDTQGHSTSTEHWNAQIAVAFSNGNVSLPSGDDPDYTNPYGMYISDLSWNRVN